MLWVDEPQARVTPRDEERVSDVRKLDLITVQDPCRTRSSALMTLSLTRSPPIRRHRYK